MLQDGTDLSAGRSSTVAEPLGDIAAGAGMKPVLVVSPHLDDAVYSAGQFLAGRPGAVVVTMFAGQGSGVVDFRCCDLQRWVWV